MADHETGPEAQGEPGRKPGRVSSKAAAAARMQQQQTWVDLQVRQAMDRGDFENLSGAGKPIEDLGTHHDPDWWLKKLVERERLVVLPPSVQLRREDAELDDRLDTLATEQAVRREVEEFNARVIAARYRLPEGPPLITMPRDLDETVAAWRERRTTRRATQRARLAAEQAERQGRGSERRSRGRRERWWRRGRGPAA